MRRGGRRGLRGGVAPLPWTAGSALRPLLVLAVVAGCSREPPSDPELRAALGIDDARPIHRIDLGGRGSEEHVVPVRIEVEPGDLVQFVVVDRRVHTISFDEGALARRATDFLEDTGQVASPPLVRRGARFVVSFEGAPPGVYPFVSQGNGDPARGSIVVLDDTR